MANTLALRRKIKTAQNVSKTTRAMQMIAASKLKRAQDATMASRPYVEKLIEVMQRLSTVDKHTFTHPYLATSALQNKKTLLIIISPDKGLCGGLITNLLREYTNLNTDSYVFLTIGKKGEYSIARLGKDLIASFPIGITLPSLHIVYPLAKLIDEYFLTGKVQKVEVLSTHFISLFSQKPLVNQLLPLVRPAQATAREKIETIKETLFEPDAATILPPLLQHYLEMTLYQYIMESYVSEQGARMIAMQNATDNAKDIIEALRLEYNKARQTRITNEILDISSAANALYA